MADPRQTGAIDALARLMTNLEDLSGLSDDDLVQAVVQARETKKIAEGKVAAELRGRRWTWPAIGKAIGVDPSTAHGWAQPYLRGDSAD